MVPTVLPKNGSNTSGAVSAATVSTLAQALGASVLAFHRPRLTGHYRFLTRDGVSARIRLLGKVKRRLALCVYGVTTHGKRELTDLQIVQAEGEDTWYGFLWSLRSRGLHGEFLELMANEGQSGLIKALVRLWPAVPQ
jgi:transposase-like protein